MVNWSVLKFSVVASWSFAFRKWSHIIPYNSDKFLLKDYKFLLDSGQIIVIKSYHLPVSLTYIFVFWINKNWLILPFLSSPKYQVSKMQTGKENFTFLGFYFEIQAAFGPFLESSAILWLNINILHNWCDLASVVKWFLCR